MTTADAPPVKASAFDRLRAGDPATLARALTVLEAGGPEADVERAVAALRRAAQRHDENVFAAVVDAAEAGVTHGEIVSALRDELGFGDPLVVA